MNLSCPLCHACFPLETLVQDESARELMVIVARAGSTGPLLVAYLGLFRSKSRALAWDRALRLAKEVLELGADPRVLAAALGETVEAMRRKREAGQVKPLKDHAYLKKVMESQIPLNPPFSKGEEMGSPLYERGAGGDFVPPAPKGKRRMALEILAAWAGGDWLRTEIAQGLQALLADNRQGAPGADSVEFTAGLWETLLRDKKITIEEVDAARIREGFKRLLTETEGWPEARALLDRLPRRPERKKLAEPVEIGEERRRQGQEFFRGISEKL